MGPGQPRPGLCLAGRALTRRGRLTRWTTTRHRWPETTTGPAASIPIAWQRGSRPSPRACRPACNIVDLGCGTSRFTQALADFYGADVLGVDPSVTMLEQAAAKAQAGAVRFARGSAESIPAPAGSADLVFSSMAFHHFADRTRAAREIRRVLRPGGFVIVRNATRENSRRSPHARCFTGFIDVIDRHQPTQAEIVETFAPRGFVLRAHDLVFQAMAARLGGVGGQGRAAGRLQSAAPGRCRLSSRPGEDALHSPWAGGADRARCRPFRLRSRAQLTAADGGSTPLPRRWTKEAVTSPAWVDRTRGALCQFEPAPRAEGGVFHSMAKITGNEISPGTLIEFDGGLWVAVKTAKVSRARAAPTTRSS
ncbi:MAG: class I SAM-dependent methyltransferase [Rhizomicrobium sp.]